MAQCEDCLHYEICEIMSEQYGISKVYPSQCGYYKHTADVVPKSEVDKWYREYHAIKDELKREKMYHRETEKLADRYCVELQTAKADFARKIFADIEKFNRPPLPECEPVYVMKASELAELKKKQITEVRGHGSA